MSSPFINIAEHRTTPTSSKTSWPELVGCNVDVAIAKIKACVPSNFNVFKIDKNAIMTTDYKTNRIRVHYDPLTNNVAVAPHIA